MKHIKEFLQRDYISEIMSSLLLTIILLVYGFITAEGTIALLGILIGLPIGIGSINEYRKIYGTSDNTFTKNKTDKKHCA